MRLTPATLCIAVLSGVMCLAAANALGGQTVNQRAGFRIDLPSHWKIASTISGSVERVIFKCTLEECGENKVFILASTVFNQELKDFDNKQLFSVIPLQQFPNFVSLALRQASGHIEKTVEMNKVTIGGKIAYLGKFYFRYSEHPSDPPTDGYMIYVLTFDKGWFYQFIVRADTGYRRQVDLAGQDLLAAVSFLR